MYILVLPDKIVKSRTRRGIEMKIGGKLEEKDFKRYGNDRLCIMTSEDITFVKDKKSMSRIPMSRLYQKDKDSLLLIAILIVQFIILIKG